MRLFKKLFGSEEGPSSDELLDAGACPNCWGTQEYNNQFVAFVEDQTKSNISLDHSKRKAFIQQFVEDRVTGIKLKEEGAYNACPICKKKYRSQSK